MGRGMRMRTGIQPLDERLGGLRPGGLYVVAGVPGSGRLLALLQVLAAGLEEGERVALLSAAGPDRVLEEAAHWGIDLRKSWQKDELRLLSFKPEFERRLLSAADPGEVFEELSGFLEGGVARLAVHPGTPLWETRSGTSAASHFVRWAESADATCWVTLASDLEDTLSAATEWVLESAAGVFHLERLPGGLHELRIRHLSPPAGFEGPITLSSAQGRGLGPPAGPPARRRTDVTAGSETKLALVRLGAELPGDVAAWLDASFEVVEEAEPLGVVERLQDGEGLGLILLFAARGRMGDAARACRVIRGLTPTPILVATDDRVRSTDRVRALEAGASDVVDAPLAVPELASRFRRARSSASPDAVPRSEAGAPAGSDEMFSPDRLAELVRDRLGRPEWRAFALLRIRGRGVSEDRLVEALLAQTRTEEGDAVGRLGGRFAVLLSGARSDQARAFAERVRRSLADRGAEIEVETLSGLADRERIEAALGEAGAATSSPDGS